MHAGIFLILKGVGLVLVHHHLFFENYMGHKQEQYSTLYDYHSYSMG